MFAALPLPNFPQFIRLRDALAPYGVSPDGLVLEGNSNELSNVSFRIALLDERINLKFTYESFEISLTDTEREPDLMNTADTIVSSVMETMAALDTAATAGAATMSWRAHMAVESGNEPFFSELIGSRLTGALKFRPVSLVVEPAGEGNDFSQGRFLIQKSFVRDGELFVELTYGYAEPLTFREATDRFMADKGKMLAQLDLQEVD